MPMKLIKGSYKILGASPDGDSVRFYPATPSPRLTATWPAGLPVRQKTSAPRGGAESRERFVGGDA
jgi:hypothetical protein